MASQAHTRSPAPAATSRIKTPVPERGPVAPDRFLAEVASTYQPVVLRGQATEWPSVQAARTSTAALVDYLRPLDAGKPVEMLVGPPEIGGRFFYNDDITGCNFQKRGVTVSALLTHLLATADAPNANALYAGAAAADDHLPGWAVENPLGFPLPTARARVWIGNRTHVATHFDEASNVAVVIGGRRRFTLFPPEQFENLYVGPLHLTIAGPPVSMVDLEAPDLDRYPRFAEAARHGMVADLEPGDAIYIPPIWWHNVRALAPVNVMMNYWWEDEGSVSPLGVLSQAILAMRDLPHDHRRAWQRWFEHYVFDDEAPTRADHLPAHARGVLGAPSADRDAFLSKRKEP